MVRVRHKATHAGQGRCVVKQGGELCSDVYVSRAIKVEVEVEVVTFPATRAWGHRPMRVFFDKAVSKIKLIKNFVPKKGVMKQARCY